jgi:hypothetical protein
MPICHGGRPEIPAKRTMALDALIQAGRIRMQCAHGANERELTILLKGPYATN